MPHISSPVLTASLSGWVIEKTKTINDGLSTGKRRALTLAVTLVVLPIFAVLDALVIYLAASLVGLLLGRSTPSLKLVHTILFIVQVPFLMLANLFGANLLPKVNHSNFGYDLSGGHDGTGWTYFYLKTKIEKFKLTINQYKHGECSFEEFTERKKNFTESSEEFGEIFWGYINSEPFPVNEHLPYLLPSDAPKTLVDRLLGKPNAEIIPGEATNQALEETYYNLILSDRPVPKDAFNWKKHPAEKHLRNLQTAMVLMEHMDQSLSQNTKDHLIQNFPRIYEQVPFELTKSILNYLKRTADLEFCQEIMISLVKRSESIMLAIKGRSMFVIRGGTMYAIDGDSPDNSDRKIYQEHFQFFLNTLPAILKEQIATRVAVLRARARLTPSGIAELVANYEVQA